MKSGNGKPSGYPPNIGSIVARSRGPRDLPAFISLRADRSATAWDRVLVTAAARGDHATTRSWSIVPKPGRFRFRN